MTSLQRSPPTVPTPRRHNNNTMMMKNHHNNNNSTAPSNMTQSMTIDEMRTLHHQAVTDAESKRTELRLVLASRYRELVGSSDEVLRMRERAEELHHLITALPVLLEKVVDSSSSASGGGGGVEEGVEHETTKTKNDAATTTTTAPTTATTTRTEASLKQELARLPRDIHRALDQENVYTASLKLMELMTLMAPYDEFGIPYDIPTANKKSSLLSSLPPPLQMQLRMTHRQCCISVPQRILRMAKQQLLVPSSSSSGESATSTAHALASIQMLELPTMNHVALLDLYFDSKATLLQSLLNELQGTTKEAESILCQMVVILQKDIILHPHSMFCISSTNETETTTATTTTTTTPLMERDLVRAKVSHFLAAHLPLIRTKVKSVLMDIAGTTAHALGQIRQSLYDVTNNIHADREDWTEAVRTVVDVKIVLQQQQQQQAAATTTTTTSSSLTTTTTASSSLLTDTDQRHSSSNNNNNNTHNKFSLWSALFSNTFSNLVHSLLTSSFHSVHTQVVQSLKTSLANAPPTCAQMLPHEAHRNTLTIATNLDLALKKVSDDAHELLVHAEEREESERRLRQSLYVQTCEIMGRLLCELRRMMILMEVDGTKTTTTSSSSSSSSDTKEYVVGRLCHLLQYRLSSLQTLLDPSHAGNTTSMITLVELQSAFELADDDDDGLITWDEAMEAVDAAFSGYTTVRGSEMIRETWSGNNTNESSSTNNNNNRSLTLAELSLLSARGLQLNALETIQESLSSLVHQCFATWAMSSLPKPTLSLDSYLQVTTNESEWQRMFASTTNNSNPSSALPTDNDDFSTYLKKTEEEEATTTTTNPPTLGSVSPQVMRYLMQLSSTYQQSICPADSPALGKMIRQSLLEQALPKVMQSCCCSSSTSTKDVPVSALMQWYLDSTFLQTCFFSKEKEEWNKCHDMLRSAIQQEYYTSTDLFNTKVKEQHAQAWESCELYLRALLQQSTSTSTDGNDDELFVLFGTPSTTTTTTGSSMITNNHPSWYTPLSSSRRFMELSIPTDRRLFELQRRQQQKNSSNTKSPEKVPKNKTSSSALGGFFSSMLKK